MKKFTVEYALKKKGSVCYTVDALCASEARRVADAWYAIECVGYKFKRVTVKEAA